MGFAEIFDRRKLRDDAFGATFRHTWQRHHEIYLNGIVLVSAVMNFRLAAISGPVNDLPPVSYLPDIYDTAWYHKLLPADMQKQERGTSRAGSA